MNQPLLKKLLFKNFPLPRLFLACAGLVLAFTLLALAGQFYLGVQGVLQAPAQGEYLFITKKITGLEGFAAPQPRFTSRDIDILRAQGFVQGVAPVQPNGFRVWAETDLTGRNYGTELFLESVPSNYMDVIPREWNWKPTDPYVPVVVAKDFINLYNFGFSGSRGLPKITEKTVGLFPITLTVWGSQGDRKLPARVVAFSQRINSLLVPPSFMDWANQTVAPEAKPLSERLMVQVKDPADPRIQEFLKDQSWETNTDRLKMSVLTQTAQVVLGFVGFLALFIGLLSLLLVQLTLKLFLTVNGETFQTLTRLGFSLKLLKKRVFFQIAGPLTGAVLLALGIDLGIVFSLENLFGTWGLPLTLAPWAGLGLLVPGGLVLLLAWGSIQRFKGFR